MNFYFSFLSVALGLVFLTQACPPQAAKQAVNYNEDCHEDRKTQQALTDQQGTIAQVGDQFVLLLSGEPSTRYLPCNLEEKFQVADTKVTFSGKVKEVYPQERWPATPFVLTTLSPSY